MPEIKLVAEARTRFGKGAARKIRRDHKIPAVIYGHGADPVHITLPGHDTMMALKNANALLSIELEGTNRLALAKDVQRDPIKPVIEHVDLVVVRRDEKVVVDVPIHTVGEAAPETVVTVESQTVQLEVLAISIPQGVEVSIEGREAGSQVLASELELPDGAELVTDPGTLVINITQQISEEELEAELAEAEAEAGIEHEAPETEGGEAAEGAEAEAGGAAEGEAAAGTSSAGDES
jgi:large subunit ribosomal protein L25